MLDFGLGIIVWISFLSICALLNILADSIRKLRAKWAESLAWSMNLLVQVFSLIAIILLCCQTGTYIGKAMAFPSEYATQCSGEK